MGACAAALWRRMLAVVAFAAFIVTTQAADTVFRTVDRGRPVAVPARAYTNPDSRSSTYRWVFERPAFARAWTETVGDPSIVIAVVDTGVDPTTVDLKGALLPGYNFNDDNDQTDDPLGHGTEVASLLAARNDNALAVTGACGRCSILPIRVSESDGSASLTKIAAGIVWAADHGARIINISLVSAEPSQVLADAVTYAQGQGALIIAAAGNDGLRSTDYPAALPGVVSVEAATRTDSPYSFSNHGSSVTLAAPGCAVVATRGGSYRAACGTSVSAPLVAGAAGLLAAAHPNASANQIADALEQGADRVGDTRYGRLNVEHSLLLLGTGTSLRKAVPNARALKSKPKLHRR